MAFYLRRLLMARPAALVALLSARPSGTRMPWLDLVVQDMRRMRVLVSECSRLPCPDDSPQVWHDFICAEPGRWSRCVGMLHFTDSLCDRDVAASAAAPCRPHRCTLCPASFATHRELAQHARIKHGVRCQQPLFARADAICPVCRTCFGQRVRLISHLCDTRAKRLGHRCWTTICASPHLFSQLSAADAAELDSRDNDLRKAARRAGHSHHLAVGCAVRADGSCVGRARL